MANIEKSKPAFVTRDGIVADADYVQWLSDVKKRFRESQARAIVKVNSEMLEFYWSIGRDLVMLRAESRWGAGVVKQFALDMRETFPDSTGFSYTNVKYMKRWYNFYNELVTKGQQAADLIADEKGQQAVRDKNTDNAKQWEEWILFMLKGVEQTAQDTIDLVKNIGILMDKFKRALRPVFGPKYNHELLNGMFYHPYTKIEYVEKNLQVSRQTASRYLRKIVALGLLRKQKKGKENYYVNVQLVDLFMTYNDNPQPSEADSIESIHVTKSNKM